MSKWNLAAEKSIRIQKGWFPTFEVRAGDTLGLLSPDNAFQISNGLLQGDEPGRKLNIE